MMTEHDPSPELIALDWGTSSLRAFLMAQRNVIDSRESRHGIQHLPSQGALGYEQAFSELTGDWLSRWPALPVVASGMVGSAQGWREAPYARCPANIQTLAKHSSPLRTANGTEIWIAPGVLYDEADTSPEVMRGEEIQIAGALSLNPAWSIRSYIVLPGTHSKWVFIENGKVVRFSTYMTGELFAVLRQHSILGRLMPPGDVADAAVAADAFTLGLSTAQVDKAALTNQIFGARTLGLTGRVPPAGLASYLSGLLIGHEIVSGLSWLGDLASTPLVVIGTRQLCERYKDALSAMGYTVEAALQNTAPAGLWSLADELRLL